MSVWVRCAGVWCVGVSVAAEARARLCPPTVLSSLCSRTPAARHTWNTRVEGAYTILTLPLRPVRLPPAVRCVAPSPAVVCVGGCDRLSSLSSPLPRRHTHAAEHTHTQQEGPNQHHIRVQRALPVMNHPFPPLPPAWSGMCRAADAAVAAATVGGQATAEASLSDSFQTTLLCGKQRAHTHHTQGDDTNKHTHTR